MRTTEYCIHFRTLAPLAAFQEHKDVKNID
jgi:hypothetical protein